jgi:predicted oxidoreductase
MVYKDNGVLDCSYDHIITSVEGSLQRLEVDHLDILLLHYPDVLVRPEEVASAFDALKRAGKVRYFGVSNHSASQLEFLQHSVDQSLVVNQVYFGLSSSYLVAGGVTRHFGMAPGPAASMTTQSSPTHSIIAACTAFSCRLTRR